MSNGKSGPPDKWAKVPSGQSDEVLAKLNALAQASPPTVAVAVQCSDGVFIFVGSYTGGQQ